MFQAQAKSQGIQLITSYYDSRQAMARTSISSDVMCDFEPRSSSRTFRRAAVQQKLPIMNGDMRRFQQVLINLVKNALKFTTKGEIEIESTYNVSEQKLIVKVKDTGIGIK